MLGWRRLATYLPTSTCSYKLTPVSKKSYKFTIVRRIVSFVMAIIVMVLSCIPCSDVEAMPIEINTPATITATPANLPGNNSVHADMCTPFCTCSCCAGFALLPLESKFALEPIVFADTIYGVYQPQSFVDVFFPIWQPPKLA